MSDPAEVRDAVVRAAVPLLTEYETLTTARIAELAGVEQPDLLAVFADKEAVLHVCLAAMAEAVSAVLDPAAELRQLEAIGTDQPLAARLVAVLDILDAYHRRIRMDIESVLPEGTGDMPPPGPERDRRILSSRVPELREAVARLLEPDQPRLRLPADVLANAFVGMTIEGIRRVAPAEPPPAAEKVVDLFLHGALEAGD